MTDPYAPPEWYDPSSLTRRLGGTYAIPINDGLGPLEGEVIMDGQPHFVRKHQSSDIQQRAAKMIQALENNDLVWTHDILDMIEELKKPADPLDIGQLCIVPIHREAIARLKELLPS